MKLAQERYTRGDFIGCLNALAKIPNNDFPQKTAILKARALTQSGQPEAARQWLESHFPEESLTSNIMALIARTWKDTWEGDRRGESLDNVILWYLRSFEAAQTPDDKFYAGINVATFQFVAERREESKFHAQQVLRYCSEANVQNATAPPNPWALASRAEAHALLGHHEEAWKDYEAMAACGGLDLRALCTVRKQARLVAGLTGLDRKAFDATFSLPVVVVFAGHRVDLPDRRQERLPRRLLDPLARRLGKDLKDFSAGISFSSAAAGSDILFLEAMQRLDMPQHLGVETHIILSSPRRLFRSSNVDDSDDQSWGTRFNKVVGAALLNARKKGHGSVTHASPHQPKDDIGYVYANLIMSGKARHHARQLDLDIKPIAVWDEQAGDGPGGTADFCHLWSKLGTPPHIINPRELDTGTVDIRSPMAPIPLEPPAMPTYPASPGGAPGLAISGGPMRQEIKAILFADVKHFSKLTEAQVESFCRHYLGEVSAIISKVNDGIHHGPLVCNTWGDAFYMVFNRVNDAGHFALELQKALVPQPAGGANWKQHDLPEELSIRIALHAGPVFLFSDPVIRAMSFTGRHVSYAARIEPVTPIGQIYASEAFTFLADMENVQDFRCEYVGIVKAAKSFGSLRAYKLTGQRAPGV